MIQRPCPAPGADPALPGSQVMRWQSADAIRPVLVMVAATSKSMQTTAQSGPSVALTRPIIGVARMAAPEAAPPDRPAAEWNEASTLIADHESTSGPPTSAHE